MFQKSNPRNIRILFPRLDALHRDRSDFIPRREAVFSRDSHRHTSDATSLGLWRTHAQHHASRLAAPLHVVPMTSSSDSKKQLPDRSWLGRAIKWGIFASMVVL